MYINIMTYKKELQRGSSGLRQGLGLGSLIAALCFEIVFAFRVLLVLLCAFEGFGGF